MSRFQSCFVMPREYGIDAWPPKSTRSSLMPITQHSSSPWTPRDRRQSCSMPTMENFILQAPEAPKRHPLSAESPPLLAISEAGVPTPLCPTAYGSVSSYPSSLPVSSAFPSAGKNSFCGRSDRDSSTPVTTPSTSPRDRTIFATMRYPGRDECCSCGDSEPLMFDFEGEERFRPTAASTAASSCKCDRDDNY